MVKSDVLAEALRLPADEREQVARALLRSVDAERGGASDDPDFEAELDRRMAEAKATFQRILAFPHAAEPWRARADR